MKVNTEFVNPPASDWAEEYMTVLDDCEKRESRLTDWERTFIDSMRDQLERDRRPSQRQLETLDNIWQKATERG